MGLNDLIRQMKGDTAPEPQDALERFDREAARLRALMAEGRNPCFLIAVEVTAPNGTVTQEAAAQGFKGRFYGVLGKFQEVLFRRGEF